MEKEATTNQVVVMAIGSILLFMVTLGLLGYQSKAQRLERQRHEEHIKYIVAVSELLQPMEEVVLGAVDDINDLERHLRGIVIDHPYGDFVAVSTSDTFPDGYGKVLILADHTIGGRLAIATYIKRDYVIRGKIIPCQPIKVGL